jgi:L-ascorbate metabolism protein UlaG (beta-lactamase superfamily)
MSALREYNDWMRITKYGHCCLLIEENAKRIITDPGMFSTAQNEAKNIDIVIITHDHGDHLHMESVKHIMKNNPEAVIVTNRDVGALLTKENIFFTKIEDGEEKTINEIRIKGIGNDHAVLLPGITLSMNTGYFIGERFFYPGDSFVEPKSAVDILALPVAGPWMKLSEALEYAEAVQPKTCVPVHDGMLKNPGMMTKALQNIFAQKNISYLELPIDRPIEL